MFKKFKTAVALQFEKMRGHPLYRTNVEKELLWITYLESFPEGTNPIMRERTEYDCQSCKSFVRNAGSMVAVIDGKLVSLWDCEVDYPYSVVAKELSEEVKRHEIRNVFLHDQKKIGTDKNFQDTDDGVLTWEHFHLVLPQECVNTRNRDSVYADKSATQSVFSRALREIDSDAVDTVIELIEQGSLYRGDEHLQVVKGFRALQEEWGELESEQEHDIFSWRQDIPPAVSRIRSSAIGTLLVDLSAGETLDSAVRKFESKVAPQNYQRPKALVTGAMVERARAKVTELGYASALDRRFAVVEDIHIRDVLFADRDARLSMNADVFDELVKEAKPSTKNLDKVETVPIGKFLEILPRVTGIELLFENRHAGNLVNLIAPVEPESKCLFKWDNNFSWAYAGDLADSIKARVKSRGGDVTGQFRASLAWFNSDDLDLHLVEPVRPGEAHSEVIHFSHKRSRAGGCLDVDMNVQSSGPNCSRNAVENITYPRRNQMLEGTYGLYVHNYTHRERFDTGFEVEVEYMGETTTFAYDREVKYKERILVAGFRYTHLGGLKFIETLPRADAEKTLWGLKTGHFHPVQVAMLSPNHWNNKRTGNKHYFFMLQGCRREGSSRGFFNEYLSGDLREHRKVFELLGSKMRTEEEGDQLSGLGFSSTQRSNIYARVSGAFNRTINIAF